MRPTLLRDLTWEIFLLVSYIATAAVSLSYGEFDHPILGWSAVIVCPFVAAFIVFLRVVERKTRAPDFVTVQGCRVWIDGFGVSDLGDRKITRDLMDRAVAHFVAIITHPMARLGVGYTHQAVLGAMHGLQIEWTKKPIRFTRCGAGLQRPGYVRVEWNGNASGSALFHELAHELRQRIEKSDHKHTDLSFWDRVHKAKVSFDG